MGSTEADQEKIAALNWDFYDLDFSVHKGRRYHDYLRGFFEAWRDRMKVITVMAGSGAFILVVGKFTVVAEIVTAFVALWAVLDVVFAPDKKATLHADLGKRFTSLAAKIASSPRTVEALGDLTAERLQIEHDEPACLRLVDLLARNDECRARGFSSEDLVPLSRWQRRLGFYGTFGMERLEQWKSARERETV